MLRTSSFLRLACRQNKSKSACRSLSALQFTANSSRRPCIPKFTGDLEFSTDSSNAVQKNQNSYERVLSELPEGAQIHLDFFGEPVTFFGVSGKDKILNAVASLDGFVIGAASKGKSFHGGGEEEGLGVQAAHSAALAWSELLRHASIWNTTPAGSEKSAPMLTYVAVAPMLAQTGVGYMKYVDHLLGQVDSGVEGLPPIQMFPLAEKAASMKDHEHLNPREKAHLRALDCMLRNDHKRAMTILLRHLQSCPGDGFALSIVMDLAHTVGDTAAALR